MTIYITKCTSQVYNLGVVYAAIGYLGNQLILALIKSSGALVSTIGMWREVIATAAFLSIFSVSQKSEYHDLMS